MLFLMISMAIFSVSPRLRFRGGFKSIRSARKASRGSEDAYHIGEGLLAIADGVGGWLTAENGEGANPAKVARTLVDVAASAQESDARFSKNPKKLLEAAAEAASNIKGSATFMLATLDESERSLKYSYVGDVVLLLFAPLENHFSSAKPGDFGLILQSEEQLHELNHPYQLGTHGSPPSVAELRSYDVDPGDLVLLVTQSVVQNLYPEEIESIVTVHHKSSRNPTDIATALAEKARRVSVDRRADTPFARASRKTTAPHTGGRPDDITVVAAYVEE